MIMTAASPGAQDAMKKKAAETAVDRFVKDGMVVGLGTGSTAVFAIKKLGGLVSSGWDITGIPTSVSSEELARSLGIRLSTLGEHPVVDVTIDGADEVDPKYNLIKGMGGALLREKIVAQSTKKEIIVVDESKLVEKLGTKSPLPVEIVKYGSDRTRHLIEGLGCKPEFRKKGSEPYVTDNHNYILDCRFESIEKPAQLDRRLSDITGVVENGLFIGLVHAVIVASPGGVKVLKK
jgi:ribose 5-phosphate isomerase A